MTLLTICQDVARQVGFAVPLSIVNATNDKTAQQLYSLANRAGESMAKVKRWQTLVKENTFTLATADQDYAFPADFRHIIPETTWNRDDRRKVINPLNSQEWAFYKGWQTLSGLNLRARIRNDELEFEQTISSDMNGETIAYEYLSKYWAEDSGGTAKAAFTADSDVALLDEEIITLSVLYRFKRSKGLDWESDFMDYKIELDTVKGYDSGSRNINLGANSGTILTAVTDDRDYGV